MVGRGVDGTILTPLSAIAAKQSKPTVNTVQRSQQIMDYLATQEPAVLTYLKSDMVLAVHSDASYLNEEEARSRAGSHHFLSEDVPLSPNNTFLWPGIVCNNHNHEFSDTLINQIFHEQRPSNFRRNTIPPLAIDFCN